MPSSHHVYINKNDADANQTSGRIMNRRRSQRIRRKTLENNNNAPPDDDDDDDETLEDPDETMLEEEDKDETILLSYEEEGKNNKGDNDDDEGEDEPMKLDNAMDVDEKIGATTTNNNNDTDESIDIEFHHHHQQQQQQQQHDNNNSTQSTVDTGIPRQIRGGAGLSYDPLTSSTMASTPFTEIKRRVARNNGHRKPEARKEPGPQTAKKLRNISERFSSDDDDDDDVMDISEQEFMREVARKRQEREALLAEEESQLQQHQHQSEKQSTSFASSRSTNNESQQQQLETQPQNGSEDTTRMANHGTGKEETGGAQSSSFNQTEELLTESFAETQPWEKELENLPSYNKQNNSQQNAPQKRKDQRSQQFAPQQDHHGREGEQNQQQPANNNNTNHGGKQSSTNNDTHRRQDHQQSDNQGMKQPYTTQQDGNTSMNNRHQSSSVPSHPQNAPQKDRRRQEYHPNYQRGKQPLASSTNNNSQLNHQSLPSFEQNSQRNSQFGRQTSHTQPPNHRDRHHDTTLAAAATNSIPNPYHRRQPPPLMKNTAAANVPKISLEHMRSRQQGKTSTNSIYNRNTNGNRDNDKINSSNSTGSEGETWQEEAFRSSLLDVLGSFPSNYFNNDSQVDESMDENGGSSCLFATSATNNSSLNNNNNLGGDSPLSTTSQTAASAQLHSKRVLDAASRSLARLAIASRHHTKTSDSRNGTTSRTSGGSSNDDESPPDFNPPSPRSLPSYMSVMNVHDDSIQNGTMGCGGYWGGGGGGSTNNAMLSSSSSTNEVFSGQSVHSRNARTVQLSSVVPKGNRRNASSNEFSSWTTEELAFGTMLLAAQVCHEASCDPNFDGQNDSTEVSESCRVAGFVQNSKGGNMKPAVSPALVESCLGFLATAFACLESDFVYSVLKSTLKSSDGTALAGTVFDALSYFAPVSALDNPYEEGCTIPTLSLLALSRGLEAAVCVARFTTLDPSSACRAYSSPHHVSTDYATVDTGIDGSGVGWLSALGRDLGLKLEGGSRVGGPRHVHLSQIAAYAYDFILEYNPMLVDESTESFRGSMHGRDNRGGHRRGKSRGSLYVDTHDSQALDALPCRQPSIMKDRIFAAIAEYLSSMIHTGVVSGWLKNVSISEGENSSRTVDRLCGQLFRIIDTRSRLRRATNQSVASPDPGDSEAVCVASLSLLILLLPEHVNESVQSLNHSFRQMGNSSGSIDDLLHSTLMKKLVDMALSWQDTVPSRKSSKEKENIMNKAISNTVYILSDIILVGGSELIASQFGKKVENFLQSITESICAKGRQRSNSNCFDSSGIEAPLLFLLQLHTGSPLLVRQLVRNFIEQSSANGEDIGYFVAGLLHLSANVSCSILFLAY